VLFSEPIFLAFFAIYFACHLIVPPRRRIYLIIAGSTVFYAWWRVDYVWLPYLLTGIAWYGVAAFERAGDPTQRRRRLAVTLVALFLPLICVKYSFFFVHDVVGAFPGIMPLLGDTDWLKVPLPLGISFVTFTLTAYVVDVYVGRYPAQRRLADVLGYVLFFPHLIAGPILRPHELMPQLRQIRRALDARFTLGAALFALGLVKKLVFADTLAAAVDPVFKADAVASGWEYLLAIYGFGAQIYCDFSGYTDMAIGLAYLLRIRLPTNFLRPYGATSIVEFWRRWHVTLSHWLRDYLYIPLGGNRRGRARQLANIMITMVLGGLWHGANWTFVIWGLVHGSALATGHLLGGPMRRAGLAMPRWLGVVLTFQFVTIAWVFFRAPDVSTARKVLAGPFVASWTDAGSFVQGHVFELLLLAMFLLTHKYDRHAGLRLLVSRSHKGLVWVGIGLACTIAITVSQGSSSKFIYFDF
jgi:alginate O-acetyltransferase complex protein AlgI